MEQKLQITTTPDGKYKNISLKSKPQKGLAGLDDGNHIIVTKSFVEGKPHEGKFGTYYTVAVEYAGEKVGFLLSEKEHKAFSSTGGVGDKVKITLTERKYVDAKGGKRIAEDLSFELVE